jgi:hypothetical protein
MLKLQVREIGRSLSGSRMPLISPDVGEAAHAGWHDSTLELRRGLDVVELPVEPVTEAQVPRDPVPSPNQR